VTARAAEWLARLIAHRTDNPGGDEVAICRTLGAALEGHGADAVDVVLVPREDDTGATGAYVMARWGRPRLLLNAHIDTVPANRSWSRDPFTAHDDGAFVHGLGAADTKGAAAAMLAALGRVQPRDVGILFSGDEERGQSCMNAFLASPHAIGIQRALVSEPTARRAVVRHRGVASFRAEVACAGGHSSRADHMPKPMVALARLAVELDRVARRWIDRGPPDMRGLCVNIAGFDGGVAFNVIPERASLTFSFRPPPGCARPELDVDILQAIADAALEEGPPVRMVQVMDRAPFATRDLEAFRPVLGDLLADAGPIDFWTEGAELARAGIDSVVIGPGEVGQAHASDERVSRADLDWAEDLYADVFARSRDG
jgi:acetylornithine deacetylase/succinyl-diaminopimelate desuccinylase-like protein